MSLFSFPFLLFLTIVFLAYYLVPAKFQKYILFLTGYLFCFSFGWKCIIALILATVITYLFARILEKHKSAPLLITCIVLCITLLFFTRISDILPAIGISFYTLQAIGYVVDVYNRKTTVCNNILDYALYVSFFPTLLSGPIERSTSLLPQIRQSAKEFNLEMVKSGMWCMLGGYCLKLLIADRLSLIVDGAFEAVGDTSGGTLAIAVILYGLQLYADFAGYSLLVYGIARVFGYEIILNFKQPYFSQSIREFWGRWHISLSNFLKDYIYIPLGGSRCSKARIFINLLITFTVSGIWHGMGLNFMVWGLIHGIYQILGRFFSHNKSNPKSDKGILVKVMKALRTFVLVDFAWIFFRAASLNEAFAVVKKIFTEFDVLGTFDNCNFLMGYSKLRFILLILEIVIWVIIDIMHEKNISIISILDNQKSIVRYLVYSGIVVVLLIAVIHDLGMGNSGFIYANF